MVPLTRATDAGRSVPSTRLALPISMTIQFSSITLADAVMAGQRSGTAPGGGVEPPLSGLESDAQAAGPGMKKAPPGWEGPLAYSDVVSGLRRALPIEFGRLPLAIGRGRRRVRQCRPLKSLGNPIASHVIHGKEFPFDSQAFLSENAKSPRQGGWSAPCGWPARAAVIRRSGGGRSWPRSPWPEAAWRTGSPGPGRTRRTGAPPTAGPSPRPRPPP